MNEDPELPLIEKICALLTVVCLLALVAFAAFGSEIPIDKDTPKVDDAPLTAVVVTHCNMLVAAYVTMPNGRLFRFDKDSGVSRDKAMEIANTAPRKERIDICPEAKTQIPL